MYVLLVDIDPKGGAAMRLAQTFREVFLPAISAQPSFVEARLLRARSGDGLILMIGFETRMAQQAWLTTSLHDAVWAEMEAHFESYSVRDFDTVD